jgi:membrane protease YdiL (CAAX protease family)
MDLAAVFLLPDGRLRAGWRLILFLVIFVAAAFLFHGAASAFFRDQTFISQTALLAAASVAGLAAVCAATWMMMSLLEHEPFGAVGLALQQQSLREMAFGIAGGAGLVGTVTIAEWAVGAIHFEMPGGGAALALISFAGSAGILIVSAASEELLFRGYPFQRLVEGTNGYVALAISSAIFGSLHRLNPHSTNLSVVNTMLAGALLSLAYLKTRALWLPIGFHFSWNWSLALLGLPVSGVDLIRMPWQAIPASSHIWVHGGDYGPEGGFVATLAILGGIVLLIRMPEKNSGQPANISPPAASNSNTPSFS